MSGKDSSNYQFFLMKMATLVTYYLVIYYLGN